MTKSAGMLVVVGLVVVAGYFLLTGKVVAAAGTPGVFTGAHGTGVNSAASGGILGIEGLINALGTSLSGVALNTATPAQLSTLQQQLNLETEIPPQTDAGTSQGAFLPAAPPPVIPETVDSGLMSSMGGSSLDGSGIGSIITSLPAPSSDIYSSDTDASGDIFS